jgi:hypothetical protein
VSSIAYSLSAICTLDRPSAMEPSRISHHQRGRHGSVLQGGSRRSAQPPAASGADVEDPAAFYPGQPNGLRRGMNTRCARSPSVPSSQVTTRMRSASWGREGGRRFPRARDRSYGRLVRRAPTASEQPSAREACLPEKRDPDWRRTRPSLGVLPFLAVSAWMICSRDTCRYT